MPPSQTKSEFGDSAPTLSANVSTPFFSTVGPLYACASVPNSFVEVLPSVSMTRPPSCSRPSAVANGLRITNELRAIGRIVNPRAPSFSVPVSARGNACRPLDRFFSVAPSKNRSIVPLSRWVSSASRMPPSVTDTVVTADACAFCSFVIENVPWFSTRTSVVPL